MFAYSYGSYLLASTVGSHRWQDWPGPVTGDYSWSSVINQYAGEQVFSYLPFSVDVGINEKLSYLPMQNKIDFWHKNKNNK